MKLAASLIVRNELDRYLEPCVDHLLEFCDEVRILDNGSTDGFPAGPLDPLDSRVVIRRQPDAAEQADSLFVGHAHARQALLEFTLEGEPTHILAIDADEFITDGAALRASCSQDMDAWGVCMQEVWAADSDGIAVRQDGGWVEHDIAMLWRTERMPWPLRIIDRGPATGRTPDAVDRARRVGHSCSGVLHLGWANRAERQARYDRYAQADGGRFHSGAHLESIMWPDERVRLERKPWPYTLAPWKAAILDRANLAVA